MDPASVLLDDLPAQEWKLRHYGVCVELVTVAPEGPVIRLRAPDAAALHYALLEMAELAGAHARHPSTRGVAG